MEKNNPQIDLSLLAYCGLYCGGCSFKAAAKENNRKHLYSMPDKYDYLKGVELSECPGCKNDKERGRCNIKDCAINKKIDHCGECDNYPCELIVKFAFDGMPHHENVLKNIEKIKEIGVEKWIAEEKKAYKCSCGNLLSWYVTNCIHNE